jgi:hypothetical protein
MQMRFTRAPAVLLLGALGLLNVRPSRAETSSPEGIWRGESLCTSEAPACHDERVVYYVKPVPNREDLVVIQADKIVNGQAVTMGSGEWHYDRAGSTLEWRMPQRVWSLKITGSRMEGTLKRSDGAVIRNVTLEKDR